MKVTYIAHSGFCVETEKHRLIFDYFRGELDVPEDGKTTVFFVSHFHEDHYNRAIYDFAGRPDTHYVLSREIRGWPEGASVTSVRHGETYDVGGVHIMTLCSTDCGVAYLVSVDGEVIYHAGDLHLWVWDGAPEMANRRVERMFRAEIDKLKGVEIDAAFLPLDPRQGADGVRGFDYTMRTLSIKKAFPMHFWETPEYVMSFVTSPTAAPYRERIVSLTDEGGACVIE